MRHGTSSNCHYSSTIIRGVSSDLDNDWTNNKRRIKCNRGRSSAQGMNEGLHLTATSTATDNLIWLNLFHQLSPLRMDTGQLPELTRVGTVAAPLVLTRVHTNSTRLFDAPVRLYVRENTVPPLASV